MSPRPAFALLFGASLALVGCGAATEPPPPPPQHTLIPPFPGETNATEEVETSSPSEAFAALRDRLLDEWLADDPAFGRELGLHEYDGKLPETSLAGIEARLDRMEKARDALAAIDKSALSADDALDLALMLRYAELKLFHGRDLLDYRTRPQSYGDLFSVDDYLTRDYAPIEERAQKLLEHEEAALGRIADIEKNLKSPMSKPVLETAILIYKGYATYLKGDVMRLLKGVGTPEFQAKLAKTNAFLADAAEKIATRLESVELPKADNSHVLGPERYKKLLRVQEGLDIPLADFKKMGEDALAADKKAYEALAKKAKQTRPTAATLLDEATRLVKDARAFLVEKKLVTIPTEDQAIVKETPPYMRWNAAFLNRAGAFETRATQAFYYITLPDPSWPKKEQTEYLMPRGNLLATTVHEVYPGHFLQSQWIRKAPSRAQKMLGTYSFTEGWAHYGEQMMIEQGFGEKDPQNRLGQLSEALLRDCRFVVSVGVHAEGMTLAQAEKRFIEDCHQDKATARQQAVRATFDPGYFAYTLGKLQILRLREDAKTKLGEAFALQRFHDALLSHGSPPIALIQDRVLEEIATNASR